uniref:Uncharacterized protein n=1 Tax=Syphacia muris TaxID=451379 RepID=A0A0N5A7X6_9BILA
MPMDVGEKTFEIFSFLSLLIQLPGTCILKFLFVIWTRNFPGILFSPQYHRIIVSFRTALKIPLLYCSWPKYENGRGGRLPVSRSGMGFRGGRGGMRMSRGGRCFYGGRVTKGRGYFRNRPFEFKKLPESAKFKEFSVAPENLVCFFGFQNVFTAQHDVSH